MNEKTELWLQEIRRRTDRKRKRYRKRNCSCLIAMNMMLMIGIGMLLQNVTTLGIAEVAEGFGSVLIRGEVSVYVVVGIAAFVCGVIFTIICIRWQKNRRDKESGGYVTVVSCRSSDRKTGRRDIVRRDTLEK